MTVELRNACVFNVCERVHETLGSIVCGLPRVSFFSPGVHDDYKGWTTCLRMHTLEDLLALFSRHNIPAGVMTE